jgi:hypothetical protein
VALSAEHFEHQATTRLNEMGLKPSNLAEAVRWGVNHLAYCTANEPPNGPGFIVWDKTVRALREYTIPLGWEKNDSNNYATVVSPDGKIAIAVAAGDERTGVPGDPHPTTRQPKGPVTKARVHRNQLTFKEISHAFPAPVEMPGKLTWILLVFYDDATDEIRSELSLPASMEKNGYISQWRERIGLPGTVLGMPQETDEESESEAIDLDIRPRANEEE